MITGTQRLWHVPGAAEFMWRDLNGVVALHDRRSGETHLLDALSQQILELFRDAPRAPEDVAERLCADLDATAEEAAGLRDRVAHTVAEFDRLGLIAPWAP